MTLKYTTVTEFLRRYKLLSYIMNFQPGDTPAKELVQSTPVTAGTYYLDHLGVISTSLKLYANTTLLTLTTHYTFDSDTSAITITSAGATALTGVSLNAEYSYCKFENELRESDVENLLESSEQFFETETNQVFSTVSDPQYTQIVNETRIHASNNISVKTSYNTKHYPLINLQTTTNGAFTLTDTTLTLLDATGFPDSGVIYVDGNKVTYSSRTGNDLTVPNTTPSIASGSVVLSHVIEISTESQGSEPSWTVLTPDTKYEIHYDVGFIKLLSSAFFNQVTVNNIDIFPSNVRVRVSYYHAWHKPDQDPIIPTDVVDTIYMIAASKLAKRNIRASQANGVDFDPNALNVDQTAIDAIIQRYSTSGIRIK
jgi:hypothetical protein